ncbi:MAG: hypothetical protein U0361_06130 [Nitrospiraceae bacterium]
MDTAAWRSLLRDAFLLYLLTFGGGVALGLFGFAPTSYNLLLFMFVSNILLVVGFTVAGLVTPYPRWQYLPAVGMLLWLICLMNIPLGFESVGSWFVSSISYLLTVAIGSGLSQLIAKITKMVPAQPDHRPA